MKNRRRPGAADGTGGKSLRRPEVEPAHERVSHRVDRQDHGDAALGQLEHGHRRRCHRDPLEEVERLAQIVRHDRLDDVGMGHRNDGALPSGDLLAGGDRPYLGFEQALPVGEPHPRWRDHHGPPRLEPAERDQCPTRPLAVVHLEQPLVHDRLELGGQRRSGRPSRRCAPAVR